MAEYNHKNIEKKWQDQWASEGIFRTQNDPSKKKCYVLDMFPYPSGEGLHVGHPKGYIATDVYSRFKQMNGYNILHPMGWDAFGLPAEQFAIKNKVHPRDAVKKNTDRFKEQLAKIGFNYDWEKEINTTDAEFYRWTQWIFLQLYKNSLAYESFEPINWCPTCQTGLANEDLEGGKCERCGTVVIKKPMRQWVLKITKYADRLLEDLESLDWPLSIKESQRNWIGRSEGAEIRFTLNGITDQTDGTHSVTVFTTRPDTLFGATFLAISAELAQKWLDVGWKTTNDVIQFIEETQKAEADRIQNFGEIVEKRGIATGISATNPANGEKIPVWVANYVLSGYGTGAIMAVPAHDERDFDFAKKHNLPIRRVIKTETNHDEEPSEWSTDLAGQGTLINSGDFTGMSSTNALKGIVEKVGGKHTTQYRIKDWVFSRQRYWGEPIPIVHDQNGKPYPVDESELPVLLPEVTSYAPTGTGESPLADIKEWVNIDGHITADGTFKSGKDNEGKSFPFKRETNTMPQWAGSSWYYLRYIDTKNSTQLINPKDEKYWSPVDLYVGGAEHATRHLIYARFWHKFLFDQGIVAYNEPFKRLQHVGLIMATDGRKMSKRYGNVVNPDDIVDRFGADALRIYEMFMGPFDQAIAWSTENMVGARRFIEKIFRLSEKVSSSAVLQSDNIILYNQTIKKVSEDIERFAFNTAIAQLMIFANALEKLDAIPQEVYQSFLKLVAPFAPHVTEELWRVDAKNASIHTSSWPTYDDQKIQSDTITIGVQINGKLRDSIEIERGITEEKATQIAQERPQIKKWISGNDIKKIIYIREKILNFVLSEENIT